MQTCWDEGGDEWCSDADRGVAGETGVVARRADAGRTGGRGVGVSDAVGRIVMGWVITLFAERLSKSARRYRAWWPGSARGPI